jgi:hypothetical protein
MVPPENLVTMAQDKPEFNQDLEILKVTIKADYALGMFLAKFTGMLAATFGLMLLWYQVRFPTPSNNPATYFDPWYYWGIVVLFLVGGLIILKTAVEPYKRDRATLDNLIERIRRKESVGSIASKS